MAFAIVAGLFLSGEHSAYHRLLTLWGIVPFRFPFVDLSGSLAAWDCARKGVDVIVSDPCDVLKRGYTYSPFWMSIDWIPLSQPDRNWVGLALGAAFLVSLCALPPPLSPAETAVRIAAVLSTMVTFAIERANPDLLIFLLLLGALALLPRSAIAKALGYGLIFLAGAIKYYPFVLLGLVARERLRLAIPIAIASLAALAAFYSIYASQIHEGLPYIAKGIAFGDMFGAQNLPVGMSMVFQRADALPMDPIQAMLAVMALVGATALWAMIKLSQAGDIPAALCRVDEARRLALVAGALLLVGCFFAGQNVPYRGVFLFFVVPGLSALARDRDAGAVASASRLALISIPLFMWAEAIRLWLHLAIAGTYPPEGFRTILTLQQPWDLLIWFGREVGWWVFIGFLATIVISDLVVRPLRNGLRLSLQPKA
ncbi:MAG TPA: hypothetical protein VN175_02425 [Rhizomicrobium sp.]|nr:hypothetical protein [Rhizomicrobium sp.]